MVSITFRFVSPIKAPCRSSAQVGSFYPTTYHILEEIVISGLCFLVFIIHLLHKVLDRVQGTHITLSSEFSSQGVIYSLNQGLVLVK